MTLDHPLDLGQVVARDDDEAGGLGSHRLVLGQAQRDLLRTVPYAALTAEVEPALVRVGFDEVPGDLGYALVDLAEEGFVCAQPLLARPHAAIVCPSLPVRKVWSGQTGKVCERTSIARTTNLGVHAVQTEEVFRSANERIAEKGRELGWAFPVPFLCECSDRSCFARLELTLAAYEQLRLHPQRYITAPGHEVTGAIEDEQTEGHAFAEKLKARR